MDVARGGLIRTSVSTRDMYIWKYYTYASIQRRLDSSIYLSITWTEYWRIGFLGLDLDFIFYECRHSQNISTFDVLLLMCGYIHRSIGKRLDKY